MGWDGAAMASGGDGVGGPRQSHLILVRHWIPLCDTSGDEGLVGCPKVPQGQSMAMLDKTRHQTIEESKAAQLYSM